MDDLYSRSPEKMEIDLQRFLPSMREGTILKANPLSETHLEANGPLGPAVFATLIYTIKTINNYYNNINGLLVQILCNPYCIRDTAGPPCLIYLVQ
jgi:hypothetical protein